MQGSCRLAAICVATNREMHLTALKQVGLGGWAVKQEENAGFGSVQLLAFLFIFFCRTKNRVIFVSLFDLLANQLPHSKGRLEVILCEHPEASLCGTWWNPDTNPALDTTWWKKLEEGTAWAHSVGGIMLGTSDIRNTNSFHSQESEMTPVSTLLSRFL